MHRYTVRSDSTNISRATTFKIVFVFEKRPKNLEKVRLYSYRRYSLATRRSLLRSYAQDSGKSFLWIWKQRLNIGKMTPLKSNTPPIGHYYQAHYYFVFCSSYLTERNVISDKGYHAVIQTGVSTIGVI